MSGRIYDSGYNPKCDICGSGMYTSSERNFNGCLCKRKGCPGKPIYELENDPIIKYENGKYILEGMFTEFGSKKSKYTFIERVKNCIFTMIFIRG